MKQLYQYISIKGRKTGFNVETRRDGRKNWTVCTVHSSLTNNIRVYGDVGWEALAEIIVQK